MNFSTVFYNPVLLIPVYLLVHQSTYTQIMILEENQKTPQKKEAGDANTTKS